LSSFNILLFAQKQYDFNENCQTAYEHILALRFGEAEMILQAENYENAENVVPLLLENYIDFIEIFITENEKTFRQLEKNKAYRLSKIAKSSKDSPYHLYLQAEIHLQWAVARLKFEEHIKAFWEVRKAYKLLLENKKLYPNFFPNQKSLGIIHALIGTIPDSYKWGVQILGLQGDIEQGMNELRFFLEKSKANKQLFYDEGILIYSFFLMYLENKPEKAWQIAEQLPTENHLMNCFTASTIAIRTGHNDAAILMLENRTTSKNFQPFYYLDYLLGASKLNRLDSDADVALLRFVEHFEGKNYLKDAYQRLAWFYLLQDDREKYFHYMQFCKTKGKTTLDADRQALRNAEKNVFPNIFLLKARLLFDAAYYEKALAVLQEIDADVFLTQKEKKEYIYRCGRVFEGLKNYEKAFEYYEKTIELGNTEDGSFFAPKSCLQMAKIYEKQGKMEKAKQYYKRCLQFDSYEYKNSMEQQAKAGLNRLKE